jgi:hypothetical protein
MSQRNERSTGFELDVSHWLIRQAAGLAPACLSSRLEEEWLADSETRSSAVSRLRFVVGCYWATVVIMNDYPRDRVPEASLVTAGLAAAGFGAVGDRHFGYVSLRSGTLFLIVGIYAALFCGLTTTLLHTRGLAVSAISESLPADAASTPIEIMRLAPTR